MTQYAMRYSSRASSDVEARAVLDEADFIVVSTVDEDGMPYGVPLSFVREGEALYFHCAKAGGHKIDNFVRDARVCATAVCDVEPAYENTYFSTRYRSVIVRGSVTLVADEVELRHALRTLCLKYVPSAETEIEGAIDRGIAGVAVYRIDIEELSGKVAGSIG